MAKYLILGNSAGGIAAAEAIREVDRRGSLAIVSDEPYPAYSRPLISDYLAGECSLEKMLFRSQRFYAEKDIETFLGERAVQLDVEQRLLHLESGQTLPWERLLIATGAAPFVPKIDGLDREGVFTFTTLEDAKGIERFLGSVERAVVIGGGLIGVSVTRALAHRGVKVTVVELMDRVLSTILDEEGSRLAAEALLRAGVEVITGDTAGEVIGGERVRGVVLDGGKELISDLVVIAIGVVPRTELLQGTGIKVNRGVVVDRYMSTSFPGVYACGDVAEAYDFIYGVDRLTPIWPNAYIGGRTAGLNMAGLKRQYPGGTAMNSLNCFDLPLASAGVVNPDQGYEVLSRLEDHTYEKLVLREGRLVGMIFVGNIAKSGIIFGLMRDQVDVSGFKDALLGEDFGLASLPEELRQERLRRDGSQ